MPSQGKRTAPKVIDLESLARCYTESGIRRLGGYATAPKTDPIIAIRAIEILLDRGWGRPKQQKEHTGPGGGDIQLIIRNIVEERKPDAARKKP